MKTATVRDLRNNFPRVSEWIEGGEQVELTKRGKVIARIVPVRSKAKVVVTWPDFASRLKRIYRKRVLPDSGGMMDELRADR
jgi:antitoxin (DNA-binding transcriptional repressor) of toxin-antitoxin stability system